MAQQHSNQTVPHATVALLGHIDHGKTTLATAVIKALALKGLARPIPYDAIDSAAQEQAGEQTFSISRVEYTTAHRRYTLVDCPGPADYRAALTGGAVKLDGAVLVVSAPDGPMSQTREHAHLLQQLDVVQVLVFLNKTDMMDSPGLIVSATAEVRDLLETNGLLAVTIPIVKGSALNALESKSTDPDAPEYAPVFDLVRSLDSII